MNAHHLPGDNEVQPTTEEIIAAIAFIISTDQSEGTATLAGLGVQPRPVHLSLLVAFVAYVYLGRKL
jgi:hypothetical protein